jgi:hypothetical protein
MGISQFPRCERKSSLVLPYEKASGGICSPAGVGDAALDRRGSSSMPKATGALH